MSIRLFVALALALGSAPAPAFGAEDSVPLPEGVWTAAFSSAFSGEAVRGHWSIVEAEGGLTLEIGEDFVAKKAPDLKLFLSPREPGTVTGANAIEGSVRLGKIQSHKGAQRYVIPKGTALADFKALVLQCEEFSKLWGTSPLR